MKDTHVMTFARANPTTAGHVKVFNKVKEIADKLGASHKVILSHSHDAKKNPLHPADKVHFARKMAPGVNIEHSSKEAPTILHHAKIAHESGVKHLHVVVGSDRVDEFKTLLHKYHGEGSTHKFDSIHVHSAGHRDPDAEGVTGISGTKMREFATNKDHDSFHKGTGGHLSHEDSKKMMHAVRKGMKLEESFFATYLREKKDVDTVIDADDIIIKKGEFDKTGDHMHTFGIDTDEDGQAEIQISTPDSHPHLIPKQNKEHHQALSHHIADAANKIFQKNQSNGYYHNYQLRDINRETDKEALANSVEQADQELSTESIMDKKYPVSKIVIENEPVYEYESYLNEKYDADDEGDVMHRFDEKIGKLRVATIRHSQRKAAVAQGWRDTHHGAMAAHGYRPSQFKAGHYIKKIGDKWHTIHPYAKAKVKPVSEEQEKKDPCWKGYKQLGMKKKGNKEVPNCIPESIEEIDEVDESVYESELKPVTWTGGHKPDPHHLYVVHITPSGFGEKPYKEVYHSLSQAKSVVKNRSKATSHKFKITRAKREKLAGPVGKLPESVEMVDESAAAASYHKKKAEEAKANGDNQAYIEHMRKAEIAAKNSVAEGMNEPETTKHKVDAKLPKPESGGKLHGEMPTGVKKTDKPVMHGDKDWLKHFGFNK